MSPSGSARNQSARRVIVGVGGGIAAYKACLLVRYFTEAGHNVQVIPTENALKFVGAATFEALSGNPAQTGVFERILDVPHVKIGKHADLIVIAPATADLLARTAAGRADDLLTGTLLTVRCPVLFAPAMHTEMWEHPATRRNVDTLRRDGCHIMPPASGRLTGKDSGPGRLPEADDIYAVASLLLEDPDSLPYDLVGKHIVISAGGTREPLDPVRYIGNRSSGKQGYALARVAKQRGARVTLVTGTTAGLGPPADVDIVRIQTTNELNDEMRRLSREADVVIMAAAVADFRPEEVATAKIKKREGVEPDAVPLVKNPDILAGLVQMRREGTIASSTVIVGFGAETGDEQGSVLDYGRAKLARKGCDLLVLNPVGEGLAFEVDHNNGWLLGSDGSERWLDHGSKALMSSRILDAVSRLLSS